MNRFIKLLCLMLAIVMTFALVACGPDEESSSSESESIEQSSSEAPTETESESDEQTESEEDDFREGEDMNTELPGYTPPYPPEYNKK